MGFLLFAGDAYYPVGGWDDYRGRFATREEAIAAVTGADDWAHLVDAETLEKLDEMVTQVGARGQERRVWR